MYHTFPCAACPTRAKGTRIAEVSLQLWAPQVNNILCMTMIFGDTAGGDVDMCGVCGGGRRHAWRAYVLVAMLGAVVAVPVAGIYYHPNCG